MPVNIETTAEHPIICKTQPGFPVYAHQWTYLGKNASMYRCNLCGVTILKKDLKEGSDA